MNQVTMRHADLDVEITVPESAVPIHMASGWVPVDESAPDAATPSQPVSPSKPARGGSAAKDKE